jgi:hypothetical protein
MGSCAKCGRDFGLYTTKYASGTLYDAEMGFELSLDDRYPENPYREKNLCKKCYEEVYENAPELPVEKSLGSMGKCAKCGKKLGWADEHHPWNLIKDGYINLEDSNLEGLSRLASLFPELKSEKLCIPCVNILSTSCPSQSSTGNIVLNTEINRIILWQKDEFPVVQAVCKEFFEDRTIAIGARVGHNGFLVVTNQRILFACKLGMLSKEYAVNYGMNLENIVTVSHGRFGFNDKLVILENDNQHRDFINPKIQSIIPTINLAVTERKNQLHTEKRRDHVQIILDFSSLKDIMAKGGLVMSTYKCPNCSGMVDIPEVGKMLMCKYCGTPIKPVDIFEKINSLIQSDVYSIPVPERQQRPIQVHSESEPEHQRQPNQSSPCRTCSKSVVSDELSRNEGICDECWDTAKLKEDGLS